MATKALLVGNSHADAIKNTVAKALPNADLYLLNENNPLSDYSLDTYKLGVLRLQPSIVILHSSPGSTNLRSLEVFAKFLKDKGIRFFVISPVPRPGKDVPRILLESIQRGIIPKTYEMPGFNSDQYLIENKEELLGLAELAADFSVKIVPTVDLFCSPNCQLVDMKSSKPLYFDSNHLTLTGSRVLLNRLLEALNK
jgi:hypothetical protein